MRTAAACMAPCLAILAWPVVTGAAPPATAGAAAATEPLRRIEVDASAPIGSIRALQGVDGLPMGTDAGGLGIADGPDLRQRWKDARVNAVRTYIWHARLDTVDNPGSLFPRWSADADDPASYNFAAADAAVRASREIGADILFTIASAIPQNTRPPADLPRYAQVVQHIVRHFCAGWANGFDFAVRYWEIGDEPDLNTFHFSGTPDQFYAMYEAAARAVKTVDPSLQVGGPALAFPLNESAPYREGFLKVIKQRALPFDFFSWKWYSDATQDPFDINRVAKTTTAMLEQAGLSGTPQFITDWNFNAIPIARPDRLQMGVYESATLTYMQDSIVAKAFLFRGDAGMGTAKDRDPDLTTRMFNRDATPMLNGYGFLAAGRMRDTPQRLAVVGADDKGFAVLAGVSATRDQLQVLITNYAIPAEYLKPTTRTSLDFDLPIAATRVPVSMKLPARRTDAAATDNGGYALTISHLPNTLQHYQISRYRLDKTHALTLVDTVTGHGSTVRARASLPAPSVELIIVQTPARVPVHP
jgi:xylan 1,4-beta-xylosidase